ncbi:AraC-like ligand-binding domain-containing protein (plasmid) [Methylobacterium oryzae CBMB20]
MVQTTTDVEQEHAFEFWRHAVLGRSGDATTGLDEQRSFTARRFVAVTAQSTLLHTRSNKISVERLAHHIRRDDRDDVTIVLLLHGGGFHEQGNHGALLSPGDIGFAIGNRPYFVGSHGEYEEIRLVTSRTAFRTHVGEPEAFAGGKIGRSALSELFASYLRGYAGSVARMSETEAGIAVEAALHLLRGLAGVPSSEVSTEPLRVSRRPFGLGQAAKA